MTSSILTPADGVVGRRRRWFFLALAVVVVAVGAAAAIATRGSERAPLAAEGRAPSFDLPRVGAADQRVTLEQFRGRPVLVNFWASWCVPCRKEMPALQAAYERAGGRVAFVGVNEKDGASGAVDFQRSTGVRYPSGYDPQGTVGRRFGVRGLPTTVFVDASGQLVGRRLGEVSADELRDLIRTAFDIDIGLEARA